MNRAIVHSKLKNTGILFELLTRQITADILNNNKNPKSVDLVKKYFAKNTQLGKEWKLYHILTTENYNSETKADKLVDAVINSRQKLHNADLRREKYNLIKEIKEAFPDVNSFFNARIPNYKVYASIYKMFLGETSVEDYGPDEIVNNRYTIMENIVRTDKNKIKELKTSNDYFKKQDRDLQLLAYEILVEKFNSKYNTLNKNQKVLLREYINNVSNTNGLREFVNAEVGRMAKLLTSYMKHIDDKITKIKLKEAINQSKVLTKGKIVKDDQIVALMRWYQLEKEIINVLNR